MKRNKIITKLVAIFMLISLISCQASQISYAGLNGMHRTGLNGLRKLPPVKAPYSPSAGERYAMSSADAQRQQALRNSQALAQRQAQNNLAHQSIHHCFGK